MKVRWLPNWYATRLHAVPEGDPSLPGRNGWFSSLCATEVSESKEIVRRSVKHPKRCANCERIIRTNQ